MSDRPKSPDHVLGLLRPALDAIAADLGVHIEEDVPQYRALLRSPGGKEEFDATVRRMAELVLTGLSRPLSDEELATASALGAQRATQGFSFEAVRSAVTIAMAVGRRHLLRAWAQVAAYDLVILEVLLDRLADLQHAIVDAIENGFRVVQEEQTGDREMAREAFVRRLLEEPLWDTPAAVQREAADLDVVLTLPLWLVLLTDVAAGEELSTPYRERLGRCFRAVGEPTLRPVPIRVASASAPTALLLTPGRAPSVAPACLDELGAACGELSLAALHAEVAGLVHVNVTFIGLRQTAPLLRASVAERGKVMGLDDLIEDQAVDGLPLAMHERLIVSTFVGYLGRGEKTDQERLRTLEEVCDAMRTNHSAAAARLGVRRQTVPARLAVFERTTGLRIERDHRRIRMALQSLRQNRDRVPPLGDPRWRSGDIHL